jgi:hypothetical protein
MKALQIGTFGAAAVIGLAAVSSAFLGFQGSGSPQGDPPPAATEPGPDVRVEAAIAMVGDAGSLESQGVETVVTIYNDSTTSRTFRIEWLYDLGGPDTIAGQSGPLAVAPGQSLQFTTANAGETNWPFFNNAPRDTLQDFVGRAIVYSDPEGFRGVAIEAYRLGGLDVGFPGAHSLTQLNVYRYKDMARQAGD